jgi:excisionase family DNA binding protein
MAAVESPAAEGLTKTAFARALSVSLATVNRLMASRQVRFVKIRGSVRIPRSEVDRLLRDGAELSA